MSILAVLTRGQYSVLRMSGNGPCVKMAAPPQKNLATRLSRVFSDTYFALSTHAKYLRRVSNLVDGVRLSVPWRFPMERREAWGSDYQAGKQSISGPAVGYTRENGAEDQKRDQPSSRRPGTMAPFPPPLSVCSHQTGSLKSIHSAGAGRCSAPLLAWRGLKNPCPLKSTPQTGEIQFSTGAAHFLNFLSPSLLTPASTPSTD
ncbi:hypothetical protein LZ32DRAFT_619845 [Colletotrichum eremochloae]|nr:hypothetical protein LZ32DRAFT_619845 [Colletotrichum eremochloae]